MDLSDPVARETWRSYLGELFADRLVICGFGPLAAFTSWVALLRSVGSRKPLLVVTGRGAGPVPTEDEADVVPIELPRFPSMTEELRQHDHLAHDLPPEVVAAVEAYDPAGEAVWFLNPFVVNEPVLRRPVLGGRPAAWLAAEDKILAEEIWETIGYPHAASRIVEVHPSALHEAAAELDGGVGTVWTGDTRSGFNGGGDFVRWVVTPEEQESAFAFFATRCDRVRMMPFLDGVPCSIHGIMLPDGTAAFRPVELAILRDPAKRKFVYGGQGSFWDPPDDDREQMRDLVRRTGEHVRERLDYRGAFGIDGVLTRDGFRPTEINTRMAAGLVGLAGESDVTLFTLLQTNQLAGREPRVRVDELESWALSAFDAERFSRALAVTDRVSVDDSQETPLGWDGMTLARCETVDANMSLVVGPSAMGIFARLTSTGGLAKGDRIGPLNVAMMRFLDEELGTGFGEVEAAPDVRPRVAH